MDSPNTFLRSFEFLITKGFNDKTTVVVSDAIQEHKAALLLIISLIPKYARHSTTFRDVVLDGMDNPLDFNRLIRVIFQSHKKAYGLHKLPEMTNKDVTYADPMLVEIFSKTKKYNITQIDLKQAVVMVRDNMRSPYMLKGYECLKEGDERSPSYIKLKSEADAIILNKSKSICAKMNDLLYPK